MAFFHIFVVSVVICNQSTVQAESQTTLETDKRQKQSGRKKTLSICEFRMTMIASATA